MSPRWFTVPDRGSAGPPLTGSVVIPTDLLIASPRPRLEQDRVDAIAASDAPLRAADLKALEEGLLSRAQDDAASRPGPAQGDHRAAGPGGPAQAGHARKLKGPAVSQPPGRSPSFRNVFAHREFRVLWASYVLSAAGDRLALVALTLLVYGRSRSPLLAAVTFAAGFVPYLFGSMLLSGLADRLPRRTLMVGCDLARLVLVAAMLWPGASLAALITLLYLVTLLQPPFDSSPLGDHPRRDGRRPVPAGRRGHAVDHPRGGRRGLRRRRPADGAARRPPRAGGGRGHVRRQRPADPAEHPGPGRGGGARRREPSRSWPRARAWSSATRRCAPSCAWAGWRPSSRSPRGSPSRTPAASAGALSPPGC